MFVSFRSVKGGDGCTVVSCGVAAEFAARGETVMLVGGGEDWFDAAAVFGVHPSEIQGVSDGGGFVKVSDSLIVSSLGDHTDALGQQFGVTVTVNDMGLCQVVSNLEVEVLVVSASYLSLRRFVRGADDELTDGVVVLQESGASLDSSDVESVTGLPVWGEMLRDPSVARAVDAGVFGSRLPSKFKAVMSGVVDRVVEQEGLVDV